ncbi:MAG TPA: hypothetical protein VLY04_11700, partial [Bryobacteraceae bacterium]|nr:hypothetical protein [Bryobacteraceae bacterium]
MRRTFSLFSAAVVASFCVTSAQQTQPDQEVSFPGAGGLTLHGTLLVPVAKQDKAVGVLLLPGSGPTDRNGNQPPALLSDLLKQIAERLAGEGYVSLRFDKRAARTYAPDWPKDAAEQADFFSWDAFLGDAKAGLRYLQSQAEVDPLRTIVLGHSEGALIAMQIGADLANKAGAPAGLILLSVPGRTGAVILREQVSANLKRAGLAADAVRPYTDYVDLAITQILRDGSVPPNPPAGLGALFPRSAIKLLQVELRLDPAKVLP